MKVRGLLFVSLILFLSCNSEDYSPSGTYNGGNGNPVTSSKFDYSVTVVKPDNSIKRIDDTVAVEIKFESGTNKTVHYIRIRIYNKSDNKEIYNKPDNNHVDDDSGSYTFTDNIILSRGKGFSSSSRYVLEAKVWSPGDEENAIIKSLEFKVN